MSEELTYHSAEISEGQKDSKTDALGETITGQDIERAKGHLSRFKPLSLNQEGETQYQGLLHELIALEQELNDSNAREIGLQETKQAFESGMTDKCVWIPRDSFMNLPEDVKQRNEMVRQMIITLTQIGIEIGVSFNSITSALASIIDYGQKEATDTWDKVTLGLSIIPFIGATVRRFNGFRKLEKAGEEALTTGRTASHQKVVDRIGDSISGHLRQRVDLLLSKKPIDANELLNIVNDLGDNVLSISNNFHGTAINEIEGLIDIIGLITPYITREKHKMMLYDDLRGASKNIAKHLGDNNALSKKIDIQLNILTNQNGK